MRVLVFVLTAYAFSWGIWFALSPKVQGAATIALMTAYMFGPLVGAFLAASIFDRGRFGDSIGWRGRVNGWWLVAWIAAPALVVGSAAVSLLIPGVTLADPEMQARAALEAAGRPAPPEGQITIPHPAVLIGLAMIAGLLPNTIAAFGEEAGWRGYLWGRLRPMGFWNASLVVGMLWGLWHAPLIAHGHNYGVGYQGAPWAGIATMTAFCIALSPLLGFLRDRAGSVLAPSIAHGTLNAAAGLGGLYIAGGSPLVAGVAGAAGIATLAAITAVIAVMGPNRPPTRGKGA